MSSPDFLPPPSFPVFLMQGRRLTERDVGKKVIRICPVEGKYGALDFSYMTIQSSATRIFECAYTVFSVEQKCVILEQLDSKFFLKKRFLDSNWLTVDEYITKIQGLTPEFISPDYQIEETG